MTDLFELFQLAITSETSAELRPRVAIAIDELTESDVRQIRRGQGAAAGLRVGREGRERGAGCLINEWWVGRGEVWVGCWVCCFVCIM